MKKRTVWIYNDRAICGGSEVVMKHVASLLADSGWTVTVTTDETSLADFRAAYPANVGYYARSLPYRDFRRYTPRWFFEGVRRRFYRKVIVPLRDRRRHDVAISFKEGPCTLMVSQKPAHRRLAWVHTDLANFHWTKPFFASDEAERACFRRFDHVVCVSEACKASVARAVGDPGNLVTALNPVDWRLVRQKAEAPAERTKERFLFVSVGRLAGAKQFDFLLDAGKQLQDRYDFEIWIIGGGGTSEGDRLRARLKEEGIRSVHILGERDNPFPLLKQADCYVCCSKTESYCIAIQEALILGVPVLSTDFPAVTEGLCPAFGQVVENESKALERAMEAVLQNPERLRTWRANIAAEYRPEALWEPRLETIRQLVEK